MVKRLFDIIFSFLGLIIFSPLLLLFIFLTWFQDFKSPFYIAPRVGKNGKMFSMVKLRTMVVNADNTGVDSTASDDARITPVGQIIRRYKMDELTQLWNVLIGQMSLVGPRPQVKRDVDIYTDIEKNLLSIRPGITDFSSIVFADESDILTGMEDPDLAYNQLIRPWKSRLGLIYAEQRTLWIDIKLIVATVMSVIARNKALKTVHNVLKKICNDDEVLVISLRNSELVPSPPPGADDIVQQRN
ncbi:MAG TPA: sugar transferase [Candidatus Marinimicrobia bacterium]|nr:sugar transferase [Candidatus Neomarinimicrobiota bacterium]MDP7527287.1 sugar transferase [Candidatus Neomarinimicrobiota bacterium]HBR86792.1 sugar transferase [Candidatus Neomarinimicrobiota bacterium]HJL74500.1 sugar transferase [Candidatus Neomarinimicrobiota bacterium]